MNTKKKQGKFAIIEAMQETWGHGAASSTCSVAGDGLKQLGYEIVLVKEGDLAAKIIKNATVAKGTVRFCRKILDLKNRPQPANVDIPASLRKHAHRRVWETTLGEIRRTGDPDSVFIKPLHAQKLFHGAIFNPHISSSIYRLTDDFPLLAQDVIDIENESRFYVLNGKVLTGDSYRIKQKCVQAIVDDYVNPPVAYAIDIGEIIKNRKKTLVVVETNEMFSCGFNGISTTQVDFARAVEARWHELLGI